MFLSNSAKLWFLFSILSGISATYNIDDTIWYKIDFQPFGFVNKQPLDIKEGDKTKNENNLAADAGSASSKSDSHFVDDEDEETVVMTSADNERFRCKIPKVLPNSNSDASEYTGPSALGLLESLFVQSSCSYRAEQYWTYELCHGKHLRQYHEERDGKQIKTQEYFLGKFTKEMFNELVVEHEKDIANKITRPPPTKNIEKIDMPYYEIIMTGGTQCDLTGLPRRTRVLYTCYPSGRNEIYSLKEVSTCEYEVVVLTNSLCQHPSFRPTETTENLINCQPLEKDQALKPKKLHDLEMEGMKLRTESMLEAHMTAGDKPGQVKIEIRPVKNQAQELEVDLDELESVKETINRFKDSQWKTVNRQPFKPLMDPEVVKQFLKGDYCLYGGTGWWKYEFCYGKKVDQYHEEGGGKKTVINLGHFNLENHLEWLEKYPNKRPKEGDMRKQVSLFYSGGDVCDLTGNSRKVEVKLKCKAADSPSTVSLWLLEPKTCEYVLGVESPLVCDLLPHADAKTGLFPAEIVDNLGDKLIKITSPVDDGWHLGKPDSETEDVPKMPNPASATTTKVTKKTSYKSSLVNNDKGEKVTQTIESSEEVVDGVTNVVKKVTVDGVVVEEERFQVKDGRIIGLSQVVKEPIQHQNVEYEAMEVANEDKVTKKQEVKEDMNEKEKAKATKDEL